MTLEEANELVQDLLLGLPDDKSGDADGEVAEHKTPRETCCDPHCR